MNSAAEYFRKSYGAEPLAVVTAPGRVNLIGEHIDYCGLPVLPIAIDRATHIAFAPGDDTLVQIVNSQDRFPARSFPLVRNIEPFDGGDWGNYLKAAAQELVKCHGITRGLTGSVSSNLPMAAGLSSSSSLVVATALALLRANGLDLPRTELMALLRRAEQYVGTRGGGMDQAISLGGKKDHALLIEFEPELMTTPIPVPAGLDFIVADSCIRAEKSGPRRNAYNRRVHDCKAALETVARSLRLGEPVTYSRLIARHTSHELMECAARTLGVELQRRFRHVVSEADRVGQAVTSLGTSDLRRFGDLLLQSHRSLREDYEVSTPELDRLVDIAVQAGALGARLTGAGFGGCVIVACETERSDQIIDTLDERFFRASGRSGAGQHLFRTRASDGARVVRTRDP